ncbi:ArsB/NhaD family transporter [Campylobacter felis]
MINNLPMVLLGDLVLQDSSNALIFAHLLGCNVGAKLTPIGSLATLL